MSKFLKQYQGLRKELYILCLGRVMTNLGSMVWPMLTLILNKKIGLSAKEIANYLLILSIVQLPFTLVGGKLADKFNKRNIIIICDIVSIVSYFYLGFIDIKINSIFIMALAATFQTVEWPAYDALVADFSIPKDRERAYSLEYLANNLGLAIAPTLAGILFNEHLSLVFIINAVSILSSTVLIFLMIKDVSRQEDENDINEYESDLTNGVSTINFILHNRVLLICLLASIFSNVVYSEYNYLMPLDLARVHGDYGSVLFGLVSSTNCITVVLCTAIITRLLVKIKEIDKFILGAILILLGYIVFRLTIISPAMCIVSIIIFTFGEIVNTLGSGPFNSKRIPANHRGRYASITNVIISISVSLINKIVGGIYDKFGDATAWNVIFVSSFLCIALEIILKKLDKIDYVELYK